MRSAIKSLAVLLLIGMLFSACGENGMTDPSENRSDSTVLPVSRTIINIPNLILWNKMGSCHEIFNSAHGHSLQISNSSYPYISPHSSLGKWGNGFDCNFFEDNPYSFIAIRKKTIPMSDFSIELWYTRTQEINEGDVATLLFSRHTPLVHHTNTMHLMILSPWRAFNRGPFYWIRFGMRINNSNTKEVFAYYDFGSLEAIRNAFPLDTPVHIAVTKRNSDGRLQIFINGTLMPTQYVSFNEPYYTADTSYIANKSGFFPAKTFIGQCDRAVTGDNSYNAKGVIDNLKIYDIVKDNFILDSE